MTITKMDMRGRFILVCVEKHRASIPPIIDRVPTIVTPSKELITDERVVPYVSSLKDGGSGQGMSTRGGYSLNPSSPNSQTRQRSGSSTTSHNDVALAPKEVFSSSCTDFSYISGNDEEGEDDNVVVMGSGSASYAIFGQEQRIDTPMDDEDADDDSNADYERYKAGRDADINAVVKG